MCEEIADETEMLAQLFGDLDDDRGGGHAGRMWSSRFGTANILGPFTVEYARNTISTLDLVIAVDRTVATLSDICGWRLVAVGTVGHILPGEWKDHLRGVLSIVTPIRFAQMRVLLDHRTGPTRELVTAGGQVGQDRIQVLGLPQLALHQCSLLFFAGGPGWLYAFDAFRIDAELLVSLPEGRDARGQISSQEKSLSLSQLAHLLANCR